MPAWPDSGENALPGGRLLISCRVLTWQKKSKLILWPLLIRALVPFVRAPSS